MSVVEDVVGAASCTSTLKSTYWPSEEMASPIGTSVETLMSSCLLDQARS